MHWFMRLALLAAPLCSTTLAEDTTSPAQQGNSIYGSAQEAFHDLLSVIPEESLQAALTSLTKFKEGVFESHHRGVEHVHNSNPALATKLIVAAVQDLRRRQVNGTTPASTSAAQSSQAAVQSSQAAVQSSQAAVQSSQAAAAQSSQVAVQSSQVAQQSSQAAAQSSQAASQTSGAAPQSSAAAAQSSAAAAQSSGSAAQSSGSAAQSSASAAQSSAAAAQSSATPSLAVVLPVQVTTTNSRGSTVVQTTEILSEVTASIAVTIIRTNSQGTTVTEVQTKPAVIVTTTDSAGQTTVTTSAGQLQPTRGEVMTMTDERGSTLLTTYTPGGGKISSVKLITTTDAQGRPSTITSFAYVDATPTAVAGGSGNETPTTQKPGLQSGAAKKNSAFEYAVVGGLGGALAFFV